MDALSIGDGGVGAERVSGGRDQAMRPRVRQRASEEAWAGGEDGGVWWWCACSVGGGRRM